MAAIKLPDGSIKEVADGTTVGQVAEGIGRGLAKAAVVGKVAVLRIGKPRRHLLAEHVRLDRLGPRPRVLVSRQSEGRDGSVF